MIVHQIPNTSNLITEPTAGDIEHNHITSSRRRVQQDADQASLSTSAVRIKLILMVFPHLTFIKALWSEE